MPLACQLDQIGFDVDRIDLLLAEPMRQDASVVAGAGADFQHPRPVGGPEGFDQAGHQAWLG